jgi:hypothetical protein
MADNKKLFYEYFKVVTVSKNQNSFGLFGVVMIAKSGRAFEIGVGSLHKPNVGDKLSCKLTENNDLSEIEGMSFELPRNLIDAPQEVIDEVFKD